MKRIDNKTTFLKDDLKETIKKGGKISIAAAYFSMYAWQELKKELEQIDEFRFIYTSPTFVKESSEKEKREFYIRENSLYGTEFEIKLRNEMNQKAIAKECAEWIKKKAKFKTNISDDEIDEIFNLENTSGEVYSYGNVKGLTTVDLGCERGKTINYRISKYEPQDTDFTSQFLEDFELLWNDKTKLKDVTNTVIENISGAYAENAPEFIYFMSLYHVFSEFLKDISEDVLPKDSTGYKQSKIWNMLYDFQKEAVLAIINKLEKYKGCILADSVGLGKTFTALATIKYYENRNCRVLVLCPKRLADNWNTYKDNYVNNPIAEDRLNYDVLFHTDLSREFGESNGKDLSKLNWGNYDLVVIDESHNFRNGSNSNQEGKLNRYGKLMQNVIRAGVKTKVLMLSATPVNNRFIDLKNQLALAYEGVSENIDSKLNTTKSIDEIFAQAQRAFKEWSRYEPKERTTQALLQLLDFDFFELLDSVTIARSRKHITKYYGVNKIGGFPIRKMPISRHPGMNSRNIEVTYKDINEWLATLNLGVYTPTAYIFDSKLPKYLEMMDDKTGNLTKGREFGIKKLMAINLLKRLESSSLAFRITLSHIMQLIHIRLDDINKFGQSPKNTISVSEENFKDKDIDISADDAENEYLTTYQGINIKLEDIDREKWQQDLQSDLEILEYLAKQVEDISSESDSKLHELFALIDDKIQNPINEGNKKILIFSAFKDTAEYLYNNVSEYVKNKYGLNTGVIAGNICKCTIKGVRGGKDGFNKILTYFSPISKQKNVLMPNSTDEIDILIATDCLSEGQNLQDCDYMVNYDIHWNPVRIIQRFGRIDRIGSKNKFIQLVNFWPDVELDDYIKLRNKVETRMKMTVMTSTGDDNLISVDEKGDLEYRTKQLHKIRNEEVEGLDDSTSGVSIMDLGLNEFRMDLVEYVKHHEDIEKKPKGLHAVVNATEDNPPGIVFVLKNINSNINIDKKNRIHPFYMVYLKTDGEVVCDYLNPKKLLDIFRSLCKGKPQPIKELCDRFNDETDNGRNMKQISSLLGDAINSIIDAKNESDIDSLFTAGGTSALLSTVSGLNDFELICFLVVR